MPSQPTSTNGHRRSWTLSQLRAAQDSVDVDRSCEQSATIESLLAFLNSGINSESGNCRPVVEDPRSWAATLKGVTIGRFTIEDVLGYGGFGVVFRAYDPELRRAIAVKMPRPDLITRLDARKHFWDEARMAAALRHPGIVQVHDVGTLGPLVYIASEFSPGMTLQEWMRKQSIPLAPRLIVQIVMDLANTVGYAHARRVIHQDLKPANVLVEQSSNGEIDWPLRITDFGLAVQLTEDGNGGEALTGGTRRYMAPEQRRGDKSQVGTHSDVFALGHILCDLFLHGSAATKRASPQLTSLPKEVSDDECHLPGNVPTELKAVVAKCLSPEPEHRYRDAIELRDDLDRFLQRRPTNAYPLGTLAQSVLAMKRNPVVSGLLAVTIVLVFAGFMATAYFYWHERGLRQLADRRQLEARQAVDEMYSQVGEKWLARDGAFDPLQKEFLLRSLTHYERWADEDAKSPARQYDASVALHRVANMQARLGLNRDGARSRRKCLDLLERLLERDPRNRTYRYDHFYNLMCYATEVETLIHGRNIAESNRLRMQSHREITELLAEDPTNVIYLDAAATSSRSVGRVLWDNGEWEKGRQTLRDGLNAGRTLAAADPENPAYSWNVAQTLALLRHFSHDDPTQAISYGDEAISKLRVLARSVTETPEFRDILARELCDTGAMRVSIGELDRAASQLDEGLTIYNSLCQAFPDRPTYIASRSKAYYELGVLNHVKGDDLRAESNFLLAISEITRAIDRSPHDRTPLAVLRDYLRKCPILRFRDPLRIAAIDAKLGEFLPLTQ